MDISLASARESTPKAPDEDQEGHESMRLRLVDVSVDTMDCVSLDVNIRGEMNATTTRGSSR